jgi:hypothetical protein
MNLWRIVDGTLREVRARQLDFEERLEQWILEDPSILGMDLLIIGRQVPTEFGGRIDLLGMDGQGSLTVIELKRHKTPRDVVAQVLDYATWVKDLTYKELVSIASHSLQQDLAGAYLERFEEPIPDPVNSDHSMVIISSELDESSERIVQYLANEHSVNINAIFFSFFKEEGEELLGRAWLMDPAEVQERSESRKQPPWSGYWFVNVGEGEHRNWEDNVRYGFLGAGQGEWYSSALRRLEAGAEIYAYMKGRGYVGFGVVTQEAVPIKEFVVKDEGKPLLEMPLKAPKPDDNVDDPELCEWVVGVDWRITYPREKAKTFKGVFANQNVVCKLRDESTLRFLQKEFPQEG